MIKEIISKSPRIFGYLKNTWSIRLLAVCAASIKAPVVLSLIENVSLPLALLHLLNATVKMIWQLVARGTINLIYLLKMASEYLILKPSEYVPVPFPVGPVAYFALL
jgi:hypothetical protein